MRLSLPVSSAAELALFLNVALCTFALGGAPSWVVWPLIASAGAALLLTSLSLRGSHEGGVRVPCIKHCQRILAGGRSKEAGLIADEDVLPVGKLRQAL